MIYSHTDTDTETTLLPDPAEVLELTSSAPYTHTRVHTHIHSLSLCLCNTQFGEVLVKNVLVSEFGQLSKRDQDHKNTSHFDVKSHGSKITKKKHFYMNVVFIYYTCVILHYCMTVCVISNNQPT